jgi:hypothetical protein
VAALLSATTTNPATALHHYEGLSSLAGWWVVPRLEQCGSGDGVYDRALFADLDQTNPQLEDLGVSGKAEPSAKERIPVNPLGPTFTISQNKPSRIQVIAASCQRTASWGLSIEYYADGEAHTLEVGTPARPYIGLAGNSPADVMASDGTRTDFLGPCASRGIFGGGIATRTTLRCSPRPEPAKRRPSAVV